MQEAAAASLPSSLSTAEAEDTVEEVREPGGIRFRNGRNGRKGVSRVDVEASCIQKTEKVFIQATQVADVSGLSSVHLLITH